MGKPALGKGMKDLLPKTVSVSEDRSDPDKERVAKELDTNIERYLAQGFDVSPLRDLCNRDNPSILKGIEVFRENVKKLSSATTVLRSLEGYGYANEIESIMQDVKNTQKADEVLRKVIRLKERTIIEPAPDKKGKETPRSRVLRGLKVASESMTRPLAPAQGPGLGFESTDVDSLMNDLADLGSAFTEGGHPEDDISRMLAAWENEGFFLDRVREILSESDTDPRSELARFSEEVERMRGLRDRLDALDPSGIEDSMQKIRIKLPYTYMATDVEHDIAELEAISKPKGPERPSPAEPERTVEPEVAPPEPEIEHASVAMSVHGDEGPAATPAAAEGPGPSATLTEPIVQDLPSAQEVHALTSPEELAVPVAAPEAHKAAPEPGIPVDGLLEKAKVAYGNGDLDGALRLFEEVLRIDPENSKARFMIRRIGQKR